MDLKSKEHDLPMISLIKFLPEVCLVSHSIIEVISDCNY